jgi:hypothetical protein
MRKNHWSRRASVVWRARGCRAGAHSIEGSRRASIAGPICLLAMLGPTWMGCEERALVADIVRGWDANGNSFAVDAIRCLCKREADGEVELRSERFSAHFLEVDFRNRFSGFSSETEPLAPSSDLEPGNLGTETLRSYTIEYHSLQDGPPLPSERVATDVVLGPGQTVRVTDLYLADFRTKEAYRDNGDLTVGPRRYEAVYAFRGQDGLEIGLSVTFLLGAFDNCSTLGEEFVLYECTDSPEGATPASPEGATPASGLRGGFEELL